MSDSSLPSHQAPSRQIHLHFHTHHLVQDVAAQFDPEQFALTLKRAHVESVTCFARCNYGWLYYESEQFPERVHPNLVHRNLLQSQIEACHRHGLRVPVFTSVQWDALSARKHAEWCVVGPADTSAEQHGDDAGLASPMCVNTAYRAFLKAHVGELLADLPLDGIVFDSGPVTACSCSRCQAAMSARELDPTDGNMQMAYANALRREFMAEMIDFVRGERPEISITFNSAQLWPQLRDSFTSLSHLEFDVPSNRYLGSDMDLSQLVRFHRGSGQDCVGRTSRFHRGGDFQTYKARPALASACFGLLSQGCKVMIVDRLSPSGQLDFEAYELIGAVFADVALKEPWLRGALPVTEIAVLDPLPAADTPAALRGCMRMLEEGGHQFDIVDNTADFAKYAVVILPDRVTVDDTLLAKCEAYLSQGGRLLASFESGMNLDKTAFHLQMLGMKCLGSGPIAPDGLPARGRWFDHYDYVDYLLPQDQVGKGLPETAHLMYTRAVEVAAQPGAKVLADIIAPLFDCTPRSFGLRNLSAPSDQIAGPAIVRNGNTIYFAHNIFEMYAHDAPPWIKTLFLNALKHLLPGPLLRHDAPGTLRATITEQSNQRRWVVHLLHDTSGVGAHGLKTLDETIPLHEIKVSLKVPHEVRQVAIRPQHYDKLEFWEVDGRIEFVVPRVEGHTMISVEFA